MKKGFFGGAQTKKQNCQLLCCCFCHFFNKKKNIFASSCCGKHSRFEFFWKSFRCLLLITICKLSKTKYFSHFHKNKNQHYLQTKCLNRKGEKFKVIVKLHQYLMWRTLLCHFQKCLSKLIVVGCLCFCLL